jgi:hypothetical protein
MFFNRARVGRIAVAILGAITIAFVVSIAAAAGIEDRIADSADGGARLGGDYPAFHAAGSIVLDGDFDQIYDDDRLAAEQAAFVPDGYLGFAYPPHVAFAYAPLAALGFRLGYMLHSLAMAAALIGSLAILRKPIPLVGHYFLPAVAAALSFVPLLRAVSGGQNTAITVLLFAIIWRLLHDERDLLAGVAVGLLWFRPQYAIPLLGVLVLAKRFRTVAAAVAVGAATWVSTALVMGADWMNLWYTSARSFIERDEVNSAISISPIGFVQALVGRSTAAELAGAALSALVVIALIVMWIRSEATPLALRVAAISAGVLLISPHVLFYDAGLLLIPALGIVALAQTSAERRHALIAVTAIWFGGFLHPVGAALDTAATPLALLVVAVFGYTIWRARSLTLSP